MVDKKQLKHLIDENKKLKCEIDNNIKLLDEAKKSTEELEFLKYNEWLADEHLQTYFSVISSQNSFI